jgi:hypothetical protein
VPLDASCAAPRNCTRLAILFGMVDERAVVRLGTEGAWQLARDETLAFGRAPTCDLVIGTASEGRLEDTGVSRRAGVLRYDEHGMTVINESTTRAITVRLPHGPERVVGTGEALTLPGPELTVVLHGLIYVHTLLVELPGLVELAGPSSEGRASPHDVASTTLIALSARERRYCAALCEPLLVRSSDRARPATYQQAGDRLGLAAASIRKSIDQVRHRLILQGFHGLDGADGRDELVRLLVEMGTISTTDLELLS